MKFKLLIKNKRTGAEWWESYDKEIGEQRTIRGHGTQPMFDGNIEQYGRDLVEWFNRTEPTSRHREFVRAEKEVENE